MPVVNELNKKKLELNLMNEVKWTKVTENYLEKYKSLMTTFFSFIRNQRVKVRIMFRQNAYGAISLSNQQKENGYFLLYYQFIKHAFGLAFSSQPGSAEKRFLRLYFDELPDSPERCDAFKSQIFGLQSTKLFSDAGLIIRRQDIADVDSKQHVLLQCVDIVLGAMAFRLNLMHKAIPAGKTRRGKRTIAKEKLYKHILQLREVHPGFNIGMSTSGSGKERWEQGYRHWNFIPKNHDKDEIKFK